MASKVVQSRLPCPKCPSSDGYHLYDDGHGYCYSCQYLYLTGREQDLEYTYEYLPWRGVSSDTFRFYDVKTAVNAEGEPVRLGYPYANGAYKVRTFAEKDFRWKKNEQGEPGQGLFGRDKFSPDTHKYLTITEGELDACSLYQVLKAPVVSVRSAGSAVGDITADLPFVKAFERVYLAFDNDPPGRDAAEQVARLFDHGKVFVVRFDPRKDANEWLGVDGGEDQLKKIWWNAKPWVPSKVISGFDAFEELLATEPTWGISYPFKTLTEMTYGIRKGESVLIKAQEKVGKTSLMHCIEHHILKENPDAKVLAIFLEELPRRHLQALAGLELGKPIHLPDTGVTPSQANAALRGLLQTDGRLHVYNHFGADSTADLLSTVRYLVGGGGDWYVLFDHVGMANTASEREMDERRGLEYLCTRLEMMVKELDFSLLFVSHVNDFGQTRGSHYLTKLADITIDARRDTMAIDEQERMTIHLSIPFNRYAHHTGAAGDILFDPLTYTYKEVTNAADFQSTSVQARGSDPFRWEEPKGKKKEGVASSANDNTPSWLQGAVA